MSIHITFTQLKQSDAVEEHIHKLMEEIIKMTDNKFSFHVNLFKVHEHHEVTIHCSIHRKALTSKATHENLYKAIAKSIDAMKTQVIKKIKR